MRQNEAEFRCFSFVPLQRELLYCGFVWDYVCLCSDEQTNLLIISLGNYYISM